MESLCFLNYLCDGRGGNTVKRNNACHDLQFPEYSIDFRVKRGFVIVMDVKRRAISTDRVELRLWVH